VAKTPVLVVDDHALLAQSLGHALRLHGFELVTVLTDDETAEDRVLDAVTAAGSGCVVTLDLHLGDGRRSTSMIAPMRDLGARVLVLTAEHDAVLIAECLEAGADGIFNKAQSFEALVELLYDAAEGRTVMSVSAREELLAVLRDRRVDERKRRERFEQLTAREGDVLRGLVVGRTAEEIAGDVGVALSTVRTHIKSLLRKLGVNSQLAAVALARAAGWGDETLKPE
jgi:two-component system, NarL family, nitrate/nitrite response regulator NarL